MTTKQRRATLQLAWATADIERFPSVFNIGSKPIRLQKSVKFVRVQGLKLYAGVEADVHYSWTLHQMTSVHFT